MLKNRLIPVLFLKNGFLVRSEGFSYHQKLGNPITQVARYNAWNVDELIYIDISRDDWYDRNRDDIGAMDNPNNLQEIIKEVSKKCFMPLAFGGRIRTLDEIKNRLSLGADKVTINSHALENPEFIKEASEMFGSQAIIVSIDVSINSQQKHEVMNNFGQDFTGLSPEKWAKKAERMGAGEIFLNSVKRDGLANGYDLDLIEKVNNAINIPLIACGGVGRYQDFADGLLGGKVSAVAAGNIFHFKEMSYILAKKELHKAGLNVR